MPCQMMGTSTLSQMFSGFPILQAFRIFSKYSWRGNLKAKSLQQLVKILFFSFMIIITIKCEVDPERRSINHLSVMECWGWGLWFKGTRPLLYKITPCLCADGDGGAGWIRSYVCYHSKSVLNLQWHWWWFWDTVIEYLYPYLYQVKMSTTSERGRIEIHNCFMICCCITVYLYLYLCLYFVFVSREEVHYWKRADRD